MSSICCLPTGLSDFSFVLSICEKYNCISTPEATVGLGSPVGVEISSRSGVLCFSFRWEGEQGDVLRIGPSPLVAVPRPGGNPLPVWSLATHPYSSPLRLLSVNEHCAGPAGSRCHSYRHSGKWRAIPGHSGLGKAMRCLEHIALLACVTLD